MNFLSSLLNKSEMFFSFLHILNSTFMNNVVAVLHINVSPAAVSTAVSEELVTCLFYSMTMALK